MEALKLANASRPVRGRIGKGHRCHGTRFSSRCPAQCREQGMLVEGTTGWVTHHHLSLVVPVQPPSGKSYGAISGASKNGIYLSSDCLFLWHQHSLILSSKTSGHPNLLPDFYQHCLVHRKTLSFLPSRPLLSWLFPIVAALVQAWSTAIISKLVCLAPVSYPLLPTVLYSASIVIFLQ